MTNFLSASKAKQTRPPPASGLRVQTSANGLPRPIGWGQARLAGNLLWYGNFSAVLVQAQGGGGGGKGGGIGGGGGGKNGAPGGTYQYYAGVAFGVSEGPIDSMIGAWQNKSALVMAPQSLKASLAGSTAGVAFTFHDGDYQQTPWPYLLASVPTAAQNFRGLAYEADSALFLGDSPELPNMTWEPRFLISGGLTETAVVPGTPFKVTSNYFDWDYGVVGRYAVPVSPPYTILPQEDVNALSSGAAAINPNNSSWRASDGGGVIWDLGATNGAPGTPLAKNAGAPAAGQYQVSGNSFIFNAADAGQPVVIVTAALSPGVYFGETVTADLVAGSAMVINISSATGGAVGARLSAPGFLAPGTFVAAVSGGTATGDVASGSALISNISGNFTASAGTPVSDSASAIGGGTTVSAVTHPSIAAGANAALTAQGVTFNISHATSGSLAGNQLTVADTTCVVAGASVLNSSAVFAARVLSVAGSVATLDQSLADFAVDFFTFTMQLTGDVTAGSPTISNPSTLAFVTTSCTVTDSIGAFAAGTAISAVIQGSITLSANATATSAGNRVSFASQATLSQAALASGTGVSIMARGAPLTQVLASPAAGQFSLSVQAGHFGEYSFAAADSGKTVIIMDAPDANPADVIVDLLTNPYYGLTQFPTARIGDLTLYRNYCLAAGLLVSPTLTSQAPASQFLADLLKATNSEIVWSGGKLTIAPYGDAAIMANGVTYMPPGPVLGTALDDDDFLENQGTNGASTLGSGTSDPVIVTRVDAADQENDIQLEYLERASDYNPAIVEAKDDAAIQVFGTKSNGTKQLHVFCTQKAALQSAQLMLGRAQVARSFSFTLDRRHILLDPMDVVPITDVNAGLAGQLVRIREITENANRSLSVVAEEVLNGTGAAPHYAHQGGAGFTPQYNAPASSVNDPLVFDAPVQLGNVMAMETVVCVSGRGPTYGGCDIWGSFDDIKYKYLGTLWGSTAMGVLTANLPDSTDPDIANTLSVDLTESAGELASASTAEANAGLTLSIVDKELIAFDRAVLTGQYKYDLGGIGAELRRAFYGTGHVAHSIGAKFARLRQGTYFTIGYGQADIGQTLHLKFLAFNPYGGGKQTLDAVSSYTHILSIPPIDAGGLTPGLIQTPDIALDAATGQSTASGASGTAASLFGTTTLQSAALTTSGNLVQFAFNGIMQVETGFTGTTNPKLFINRVTSGVIAPVYGPTFYTFDDTQQITFAGNGTDIAPAGSHTYTLTLSYIGSSNQPVSFANVDLAVTEIKR